MGLGALACLALLVAQEGAAAPASPFDQVVELEFTADDEALIEGRGPTQVVEYEVLFDGTLHIWTRSEIDLYLRVEDAMEMAALGEDDDSGGGQTPYLRLGVSEGDLLAVLVAGHEGTAGSATLHLIAAPETEATRQAAALGRQSLSEAARLQSEGDSAAAREARKATLERIGGTTGGVHSQVLADLAWSLGFMADSSSDVDSRQRAWSRARAHRERTLPADHLDLLRARANDAISLWVRGDLAGARSLEEAVIEAFERTLPADHSDLLHARTNLANSLFEMGDLVVARALQEAVLEVYERTLPADHPDLMRVRANLAVSLWTLGDFVGARALEELVVEAYERRLPEAHPDLSAARTNLANSLWALGDLAGARALRESVVEALERELPAEHPDLLVARANLAASLSDLGDVAGARALQEAILEARERTLPPDHPELLAARANLAISLWTLGDLAGAHALREAVLEARERSLPADHPDLLAARTNLSISLFAVGELADAQAQLQELLAGMRLRVLAAISMAPRQAMRTVGSEGQRLSVAVFLSEPGESKLERFVFELTETMRLVAGEAARSLARFGTDPELASTLARADELRRELNDLIAGAGRGHGNSRGILDEVTRLSLERDRLEGEASRQLAERGVVTQAVETVALARALEPGEALVGYRRLAHWYEGETNGRPKSGPDHLLAHVLGADGSLTRVNLGPADELEGLATDWRSALGAPLGGSLPRGVGLAASSHVDEPSAGARLRERILDPILAVVGAEAERLYLCSDDFVLPLPLDALPLDDEGERRLGDRISIVGEVSFARFMVQTEHSPGAPSLLALGGVDYGANGKGVASLVAAGAPIETARDDRGTRDGTSLRFEELPAAQAEVEEIVSLFERAFESEPALLTGEETTKAALFEAVAGKRFVHLATHGWFAPESIKSTEDATPGPGGITRMDLAEHVTGLAPMTLCGLAMAGANRGRDSLGRVPGILTAEELCSLDLSGCELAVLSACETNVGIRRAGQGIQSLQAALYAAGARTSITSLWKVDDAATRSLMEAFYSNLWLEGMGKAEALWEAKKALRAEGDPPANWAGWVLTGDPD